MMTGPSPSASSRSSDTEVIMGKDTWLKLHTSILLSAKFVNLPSNDHRWAFICLLILAKKRLESIPECQLLGHLNLSKRRWKMVEKDLVVVGLLDDTGKVNGFEDSQLTPDAYRMRKMRERNKDRNKDRNKLRNSSLDSRVQSVDSKNPPTPHGGASSRKDNYKFRAREVLVYWNSTHGRSISVTSKIEARLRQGATVEDCKLVIDFWTKKWTGTKFQEFIRPATLFAPTKFEDYLSEAKEGGVDDGIHRY